LADDERFEAAFLVVVHVVVVISHPHRHWWFWHGGQDVGRRGFHLGFSFCGCGLVLYGRGRFLFLPVFAGVDACLAAALGSTMTAGVTAVPRRR